MVVFILRSTFSRSTFGLYLVTLSATTLFPSQRGGNVWLERVNHVEYFFSSMLSAKVCLPTGLQLGIHICEVVSFLCSGLTGLDLSLFDPSLLCVFFFFKSRSYQHEESMTQGRLWRVVSDRSQLSCVLWAVWSRTTQRELRLLFVRVRREKQGSLFHQGRVQGRNISPPPSPGPEHRVWLSPLCLCVSPSPWECAV